MANRDDVFTIEQAATLLDKSVPTLEEWAKERGFPLLCPTKHARYVVWGMVVDWLSGYAPKGRQVAGKATDPGRQPIDRPLEGKRGGRGKGSRPQAGGMDLSR